MSNEKQTAVDLLWNKASNGKNLTPEDFEQAKAIEKQQIVEAFNNGLTIKMDGEQYYSQTYNNHEKFRTTSKDY